MPETSTDLIARAVSASPLASRQGVLERLFKLSFGGFVYNQIWEDPEVDAEALQLDGCSRIMTISSGGCNVLNYLARGVEHIDAVDLNGHHLHLLKLKLLGLGQLAAHEDFFAFFGNAQDPENGRRYVNWLRPALDGPGRAHWEGGPMRRQFGRERFRYFQRGLWKHASVGTFLGFLHHIARVNGMHPERLLACTTIPQQEAFFDRQVAPFFDMPVVKGITSLPFVLHGIGVPPRQYEAFRNEVGAGNVLAEYRNRVRRLACGFPIQSNYFAWQAFGRCYDTVHRRAIPDYLKAENFGILQSNVGRVATHLTSMTGFLATCGSGSLNRFVMLDAQDWMTADQIVALWRQIQRVGQPGSRIIFRTGASRSPIEGALPCELARKFTYEEGSSRSLFRRDRSAIYGGFHLYTMN